MSVWDCARDWAQIAPGFTPVVAVAAVLLAWGQLNLNRANQRETTAKATFREYLKLAVQSRRRDQNDTSGALRLVFMQFTRVTFGN